MDDFNFIGLVGVLSPLVGLYCWIMFAKLEPLPRVDLPVSSREVPFDPDLAAAGLIQPEFIEVRSIRTEYHEIRTKNPPQAAFIYEMGSRAPVELDYDVVDVIPRQVQVIEKRLVWRSVF